MGVTPKLRAGVAERARARARLGMIGAATRSLHQGDRRLHGEGLAAAGVAEGGRGPGAGRRLAR